MNYQNIIHSKEILAELVNASSSSYKNELNYTIKKAKKVLFDNQFDESDSVFHELITDVFDMVPTVDIKDEIEKLQSLSSLYAEAMHEHQGFSFNKSPTDILDKSELDPTLLCCYLIYWSCEMLRDNSSFIDQFHRIQLIECQLNWLSAAKQTLYYSEYRFDEEDKNRKKSKPQYEFGAQIINEMISKGYQFEELKLASEAIVALLKAIYQKFVDNKNILPTELTAFELHKIINTNPKVQLTRQSIIESFEEQWDKQYGENMWRVEKNNTNQWVLITANHLKYFLNTSKPDKSMSSALREKLNLNFKPGIRSVAVINTTTDFLCKELELDYQKVEKCFIKS